ncbi:ParB/RepB/Spo0J family partition protein [Photobacterium profundum]|uniref:ParB/RepB/Spo0J family partition protein n=1 Tax=Photobacterium profundum TaxID=74109 RepID=UPI003D0C8689
MTYVELETNGRDQEALTEASLVDITRTIGLQQFFPAIGRRINNKIEIIDGSRRRVAALIKAVGLNVLVTDVSISLADARQLASDIQTAKEHNLREVGLRLLLLRENGMNQKEIAAIEGFSTAKVTRAIQAATVPVHSK